MSINIDWDKWHKAIVFYWFELFESSPADVHEEQSNPTHIWFDDPWLTFFFPNGTTGASYATMHSMIRYLPPTTLECSGYINAAIANSNQWVIGMEAQMGGVDAAGNVGQTYFNHSSGNVYQACTRNAAGSECDTIAAQDWTSEKDFKIEWTTTSVKYYVDDVLKITHTLREPNVRMLIFHELHVADGQTLGADAAIYIRHGSITVS